MEDLLEEYKERHGVNRLVTMSKLRDYVTRNNVLDTVDEIKRITNEKDLDILIGVGLRGVLWYATIAQKAKLTGVS